MLWIIITGILIIIGFVILIYVDDFDLNFLGGTILTIAIMGAIVIAIILAVKPSSKRNFEISYTLTVDLIKAQENNEYITAQERSSIIRDVICINRTIIRSKMTKASPWIGIFKNDYSYLPLLEYNGIKYVDNKQTIQLTE